MSASDDFDQQAPDPQGDAERAGLDRIAKSSESIEAYKAEREDRDRAEEGEDTRASRIDRIHRAMEDARQQTEEARAEAGFDPEALDSLNAAYFEQADSILAAQQEAQEAEQRDADLQSARFTAHAEILKQQNPQAWENITGTLRQLDEMGLSDEQKSEITKGLTRAGPQVGLAIAARLATPTYNPDGSQITPAEKMLQLAQMSPRELRQTFDDAAKWMTIENQVRQQYASAYRQQTAAPPPFQGPRGGASPPRDLGALAGRGESAADYIRARKAQIKRSENR
jgi:chromosome segregation ATPase